MSPKAAKPSFLRDFMTEHRLRVAEVASGAGVSSRTILRLRAGHPEPDGAPRTATLQRIADALQALTHVDAGEVFVELMASVGRDHDVRQADLGLRGIAELGRHYQQMSPLARHLLLEQARLLAREMPES